jgi:hypothetical protein
VIARWTLRCAGVHDLEDMGGDASGEDGSGGEGVEGSGRDSSDAEGTSAGDEEGAERRGRWSKCSEGVKLRVCFKQLRFSMLIT